jgi:hypothetical protein
MTQAQSVQEHLAAMRDELKTAAQKKDAEARTSINAALQHAQQAQTEMQSRTSAGASETMKHLDELTANGKKALQESGDALHARIDTMMAHAKNAIEAGKKA